MWQLSPLLALLGSVLVGCCVTGSVAQDAHEEHGAWEWAGVFDLKGEDHTLIFGNGAAHCKLLLVATTSANEEGIESVEETAEATWEDETAPAEEIEPFDTDVLVPGTLYEIHLDNSVQSFRLSITTPQAYVLFLEHSIAEVESPGLHFLKDAHGHDVEPAAVEAASESDDADHDDHGKIGLIVVACLIVTAVSAVGLLVIVPVMKVMKVNVDTASTLVIDVGSSFASGALLSTMSMLMMPEALMMYSSYSEADRGRIVGAWFLFGFIAVAIIGWVGNCTRTQVVAKIDQKQLDDPEQSGLVSAEKIGSSKGCSTWRPVAWSVLFGDFLHNFSDGIAIGVAFNLCGESAGWAVAVGAVLHEIFQELADFIVLTTKGKLSIPAAICANLLSGTACLLGGLLVAGLDFSPQTTGAVLAFGSGTYAWIGTVECYAHCASCTEKLDKPRDVALRVLAFLIAAVAIVLALSGHEHCEAAHAHGESSTEEAGGGHHDHDDHGRRF